MSKWHPISKEGSGRLTKDYFLTEVQKYVSLFPSNISVLKVTTHIVDKICIKTAAFTDFPLIPFNFPFILKTICVGFTETGYMTQMWLAGVLSM